MDPVARDDHNYTYRGEHYDDEEGRTINEGVGDLSCRVDGAYTFAHFKPTEEELALLNEGGVVELHILGHPLPPLGLDAVPENPEDDIDMEISTNGDGPNES